MAPRSSSIGVGVALLLSAVAYLGLGYFTQRANFYQVIGLLVLAFASYSWFLQGGAISIKNGLLAAVGFRLLLLFCWPALSDDYFRFLWDGRLFAAGENPYLQVPSFYLLRLEQVPGLSPELFVQLNSPHYYSVYPPVCQFIFGLSSWLFPDNDWGAVVVMRLCILAAELGTLYLLYKLLWHYQQPTRAVLWYALNPLVIVELTGNLHFEAVMIFFLLVSIYLLVQRKSILAGVALGLAIAVKILPLLFMPFLLARLGWKKIIPFGLATGLTVAICFLPFLNPDLFRNMAGSLNLYFQKFEFNASIYYLLRWLGFKLYGYNNIASIGPLLSAITFTFIMITAYKSYYRPEKKLPEYLLSALSVYFFLATTVHPWYLTTLSALAVFTRFRYPYIWSGAAILSYATYQTSTYHENLYLTAVEYTLVLGWLIGELFRKRTGQIAEMIRH